MVGSLLLDVTVHHFAQTITGKRASADPFSSTFLYQLSFQFLPFYHFAQIFFVVFNIIPIPNSYNTQHETKGNIHRRHYSIS